MKKNSYEPLNLISIAVGFALLTAVFIFITLVMPVSFDNVRREVEIPVGASYTEGLGLLEKGGIIENRIALRFLGKITGSDKHLKPGYYNLSASMSPVEIFDTLIKGRTIQFSVTIPEGFTLQDIKKKLIDLDLIDEGSWGLVNDSRFIAGLGIEARSLEGYLYPDTYKFQKGTGPETILKRMVERLEEM